MTFQIHALPADNFAPLFDLTEADLRRRNICRKTVTENPGFPCRVSLEDAAIGETVLLLNYVHQPNATPYQASHAIYVRERAVQAVPRIAEVPAVLSRRLMSLRMFGKDHMMLDADVMEGTDLASALEKAFANSKVAYVHLHNAKQGCFAASVTRAT